MAKRTGASEVKAGMGDVSFCPTSTRTRNWAASAPAVRIVLPARGGLPNQKAASRPRRTHRSRPAPSARAKSAARVKKSSESSCLAGNHSSQDTTPMRAAGESAPVLGNAESTFAMRR